MKLKLLKKKRFKDSPILNKNFHTQYKIFQCSLNEETIRLILSKAAYFVRERMLTITGERE